MKEYGNRTIAPLPDTCHTVALSDTSTHGARSAIAETDAAAVSIPARVRTLAETDISRVPLIITGNIAHGRQHTGSCLSGTLCLSGWAEIGSRSLYSSQRLLWVVCGRMALYHLTGSFWVASGHSIDRNGARANDSNGRYQPFGFELLQTIHKFMMFAPVFNWGGGYISENPSNLQPTPTRRQDPSCCCLQKVCNLRWCNRPSQIGH
jgi:hypothetical protein